jgi:hypothetical protein
MRGPKSDSKTKAEWSMICLEILRNSNMSAPQAEQYFEVGAGGGRTWRYWMDGERLARGYVREKVISRARAEGFLNSASLATIKKMAAGADVSALPHLDVPEIPADAEMRPEEAAFELWQWMKKRKTSRFLSTVLRYYGLESEYQRRAEWVEQQIEDRGLDDTTAINWIKTSYITQFSRL